MQGQGLEGKGRGGWPDSTPGFVGQTTSRERECKSHGGTLDSQCRHLTEQVIGRRDSDGTWQLQFDNAIARLYYLA